MEDFVENRTDARRAASQLFHVCDPIQNLRLKVKLQCLSNTKQVLGASPALSDLHKTFKGHFGWQEKIFSPREFVRLKSLEGGVEDKPPSSSEREYLFDFRRESYPPASLRRHTQFYTCINKDHYFPPELFAPRTTSERGEYTPLEQKVLLRAAAAASGETSESARGNHIIREAPYKIFYIMAALEVTPSDLAAQSDPSAVQYEEAVLCCVRFYPMSNLVELCPGFSRVFAASEEGFGPRVFATEGLETFTFQSKSGSWYGYTIENESTMHLDAIRELELLERSRERDQAYVDQEQGIVPLTEIPSTDQKYLFLFMLESVEGIERDSLMIEYQLLLPDLWKLNNRSKKESVEWRHGITHTVHLKQEGGRSVGYVMFPLEMTMTYRLDSGEEPRFFPQLIFQIHSIDNSGRFTVCGIGHCNFPRRSGHHRIAVQTWYPSQSVVDRMHSFFLGGTGFLQTLGYAANEFMSTGKQATMNRYGMSTVSSGTLNVVCDVLVQGRKPSRTAGHVSRTLEEILADIRKYESQHAEAALQQLRTREGELQFPQRERDNLQVFVSK